MNARRRVIVILTALLIGTIGARAGVPFSVSIEKPERSLDLESFTTFEVRVTNEGSDSIRVRAIRVVNELPPDGWYSSICSITTCYPPEVDTTEFESAGAGAQTGFTIHVMTGRRYGDTARIALQIDSGPGTDSVVREVSVITVRRPARLFRIEPLAHEATVVSGETAEFIVWAYNQASDTIGLAAVRVEDYYSSAGWESTLCVEENCLAPEVDATPVVVLDNDKATYFKLRVRAGAPGQGQIVVRFNSTRGTEPIEKRFTVIAGVAEVNLEERSDGSAFPNPARTVVNVPVPVGGYENDLVVGLFSAADGRMVLSMTPAASSLDRGTVGVDVGALPSGRYLYRARRGDASVVGAFQIER
jgi:hypothetical protein